MRNRLNPIGIKGIIVQSISVVIGFVILFLAAGEIAWINGWLYVGLISIYQIASTVRNMRKR